MTIVVETAVACAVAWALRKAKRVGGRVDGEVDSVLDAAMDRVHEVVAGKLGSSGDLGRLEQEATFALQRDPEQARHTLNDGFTRHSIKGTLAQAIDTDEEFAAQLKEAVEAYRVAVGKASLAALGAYGLTVEGDLRIRADNGSFAAGTAHVEGGLTIGNPSKLGPDNA
ncbi:hypothetical protein ABZ876_30450 [Streptomyces sp. NPDC046931]|uniref:hypothetical protein n=1 Tax=Streptomyces sp. NPDC046931 TaxID=3154806 RepID=UPI0033FF6DD0